MDYFTDLRRMDMAYSLMRKVSLFMKDNIEITLERDSEKLLTMRDSSKMISTMAGGDIQPQNKYMRDISWKINLMALASI